MKWQGKAVLMLLSDVAMIAGAQSGAPLPDVTTLVRQTIVQQRFAQSKEQDYVFREDTNDIRLRKECTWAPQCPGVPTRDRRAGLAFTVVHYSEHHFEIFWLDGVRVARVLPDCDHCVHGSGPAEAGDPWSSDRRLDDRGRPSGYDWYFNFNEGRSDNQPSGFPYSSNDMRALCARGSGR